MTVPKWKREPQEPRTAIITPEDIKSAYGALA